LVFVEELAAVALVGGGVLGSEDGGLVRPWVVALRDERCLPAAVRGPVERSALARLA
jgi:hypothetical protein